MKKLLAIVAFSLLLISLASKAQAQSDENRNKLEMNITFGGKNIVTGLSSVSTSISRYADDAEAGTPKDTVKKAADHDNGFYLSIVVNKVDTNLLQLFAKKSTKFDGSITITDTYGKNTPVVIKFSGASLQSYTDQFSGVSYSDSYSGANVTFICHTLTMNGVEIEQ